MKNINILKFGYYSTLSFAILAFFVLGFVNAQEQYPSDIFEDVEKLSYYSQILDEDRELYIHVPTGDPNKQYSVIYLLDGEVTENY